MAAVPGKRRGRRDHGFTLLEVLVAFIIAALAMGELFSVAASDLRAVDVAGRYEEALSRARSHLAAVGPNGALTPGEQQGDDGGGYHWAVRIAVVTSAPPLPEPTASALAAPAAPRAALYSVAAAISWREGDHSRVVRLATERVGPAPAPRP